MIETGKIYNENCLDTLARMPDGFLNCVVTSPPYFGLRDYGMVDQIGLEQTPKEYVEKIVAVFAEVRRALKDSGTLWVNMGDSYASAWPCSRRSIIGNGYDLKEKDLMGMPWRVAFALQADGWYLRQDIIWNKPNPMPESVTDRCTKSHEYIFLLTKKPRYFYDADAIWETSVDLIGSENRYKAPFFEKGKHQLGGYSVNGSKHTAGLKEFDGNRNKRSVWTVTTQPYSESHFATFPPKLIEPCILAGCPAGGIVYDPFTGAGTTWLVSHKLGRQFIGSEINPEYIEIANRRLMPHLAQINLFQ